MTWKYSQKTGSLSYNDKIVGSGYAGFGEGVNNPAAQNIPNAPFLVAFIALALRSRIPRQAL